MVQGGRYGELDAVGYGTPFMAKACLFGSSQTLSMARRCLDAWTRFELSYGGFSKASMEVWCALH